MKIMIVDKNVKGNYINIISESRKRENEIFFVRSLQEAIKKLVVDKEVDAIVLGREILIKEDGEKTDDIETEEFLRKLSRRAILEIPILVYSNIEMKSNYVQVVDQIKRKEDSKAKFLNFIDSIENMQLRRQL